MGKTSNMCFFLFFLLHVANSVIPLYKWPLNIHGKHNLEKKTITWKWNSFFVDAYFFLFQKRSFFHCYEIINFIDWLETVTFYNMLLIAHHFLLLTLHFLLRQLLFGFIVGHFSYNFFLFGQNHFNVAWRWHVWINTTMSTVCTTT